MPTLLTIDAAPFFISMPPSLPSVPPAPRRPPQKFSLFHRRALPCRLLLPIAAAVRSPPPQNDLPLPRTYIAALPARYSPRDADAEGHSLPILPKIAQTRALLMVFFRAIFRRLDAFKKKYSA